MTQLNPYKERYYQRHKPLIAARSAAYRKSLKGRLVWTYTKMRHRIEGANMGRHAHLYEGRDILDKEAFYAWSLEVSDYPALHTAWVQAGYTLKSSPSIDRINSEKGYILGNIRWLTHSENSRLGARSRWGSA